MAMAEYQPQEEMKKLQQMGPGKTTVADTVVAKIAGIAAREVQGVHEMGGVTERAIGGAISRITGARGPETSGVDVQVGQEEAIVNLSMIVDYGQPIPDVVDQVRQNVMNQIQTLTGLRVKEVNITVSDLYFPQAQQAQEAQQAVQGQGSEQNVA